MLTIKEETTKLLSTKQVNEMIYAGNLPLVPKELLDFLTVRFSSGYQMTIGTPDYLKTKGATESYTLGFLSGMQECLNILQSMNEHNRGEE